MPSEICDEHTASRLGWFNAARRSSILPENLVSCAQLYDYYTNGISEVDYTHQAHVVLDEVLIATGTQSRSAQSLMDLIHEENISPSTVDQEAIDELLFNHPDPYDIAETERLNFGPAVVRSQTVFAITQYIKLESPALAELMEPSKTAASTVGSTAAPSNATPAGHPDDWNMDDFLA